MKAGLRDASSHEVAGSPEEAQRVLAALNRAMQWQAPGNDISFRDWLEPVHGKPSDSRAVPGHHIFATYGQQQRIARRRILQCHQGDLPADLRFYRGRQHEPVAAYCGVGQGGRR